MSMPEYPQELPPPEMSGYELKTVSPMRRTTMASGRARQRRAFTSVPVMVPVTWMYTLGEFELFEAWFRHIITDGTQWFTGPLKTGQGIRTDYEQRFTDIYTAKAVGARYWQVSAEMELRNRQTASADDAAFPQELVYAGLFDRTMNSHWPAN